MTERSDHIIMAKQKIKLSKDDRIFYVIVDIFVILILIVLLWPLIFIVSSSFSSKEAVTAGRVFLWPVDLSLEGYQAIFKTGEVLIGYRNTILYTFFGTILNVFLTMIAAYPLSRKDLPYRKGLLFVFTFTMIFSGGMVPTYILVSKLGLLNTPLAMILPGALSVYNMVIARSFIENSIPNEVLEAAFIDGCDDFRYFRTILLPLSGSVIAVITLYYAVAHWNSYFNAFLYITDSKLYPLQLVLRNILLANQVDTAMVTDFDTMTSKQGLSDLMKYSLIVVSSLPVLIMYPFVQKHFVKGVMIGSVKG
jgi:multiple sugar transport system permease protein/putative aldouronate transport system permease protein